MRARLFAALLLLASPALAQNVTWPGIGMEQGLQAGFSASWPNISAGQCNAPVDGHGNNCFAIPAGQIITHVYGTQSIKVEDVELLAAVVCGIGSDWRTVWQGHQIKAGTVPVLTPTLPIDYRLVGDGWRACWIMWQAINASGAYTGSGRGMEWQLTFTYKPRSAVK